MRDVDKFLYCAWVERIDVGLVVVPRIFVGDHQIAEDFAESKRRVALCIAFPVFLKTAVGIQFDKIAGQKAA